MPDIEVVRADERSVAETNATSGMTREQAVAGEGVWAGLVRADPQRPSGWHHHGEHETYIYVLSGEISFDFGPGGRQHVEAQPGSFVHVPAGVVHREVNSSTEEGSVVLVRVGSGPPVVNVAGPDGPA